MSNCFSLLLGWVALQIAQRTRERIGIIVVFRIGCDASIVVAFAAPYVIGDEAGWAVVNFTR